LKQLGSVAYAKVPAPELLLVVTGMLKLLMDVSIGDIGLGNRELAVASRLVVGHDRSAQLGGLAAMEVPE